MAAGNTACTLALTGSSGSMRTSWPLVLAGALVPGSTIILALSALVPGAEDFLKSAVQLGAMVVFISNRNDANRAGTEAVLARLVPVRSS